MAIPDVTKDAEKDGSETVVFRAKRNLRERFNKLGERRNIPTINLINNALEEYLKSHEYITEDVMKLIDTDPALKPSKALIEAEIGGCPPFICSGIISTIKNKQNYIYLEKLESILERLNSINKQNLSKIYIHFSLAKYDTNKINELLKQIGDLLKEINIFVEVGIKETNLTEDHALLFIAYNKKEGENG